MKIFIADKADVDEYGDFLKPEKSREFIDGEYTHARHMGSLYKTFISGPRRTVCLGDEIDNTAA